jgi:muramoyltetrapeptide carboxypeptidase
MRVGVVATSSPVGLVELDRGLGFLRQLGFEPVVHPLTRTRDFLFAGGDEARAQAILDMARDASIEAVWCARGGYGGGRLVPLLNRDVPAGKLLIGYSDITVLHEFVRSRWNWSTLHAVMPASNLQDVEPAALRATADLVMRRRPELAYEQQPLEVVHAPPGPITGQVIGGNLSLVHTLAGTRLQFDPRDKILFLEDISEKVYAIDRYVVQMEQAGMFDGLSAIVLGDFTSCEDESNTMLDPAGGNDAVGKPKRVPLRPTFELDHALREIFGRVTSPRGIPLYRKMPVGHGPNYWPLPLGARARIDETGHFTLQEWSWLRS